MDQEQDWALKVLGWVSGLQIGWTHENLYKKMFLHKNPENRGTRALWGPFSSKFAFCLTQTFRISQQVVYKHAVKLMKTPLSFTPWNLESVPITQKTPSPQKRLVWGS